MDGNTVERINDEDAEAAKKQWSQDGKPMLPLYNVPWSCAQREIGNASRKIGSKGPPKELQWAAEDELISKAYEEFQCQLPSTSRSTFLMVFSPDGSKVASTHGDHNVYVTDLPSGKAVRKLSGHPRTPWCLAFHPSSNQILASGCLGGQVRVWDLHGGSELWTAESHTVIASLAFHPTDRMLVVATYNELHFWDWSQPVPFAKCFTASEKEKVRYVTFDPLGHKLITGIANRTLVQSQWDRIPVSMSTAPTAHISTTASSSSSSSSSTTAPSGSSAPSTSSSTSQPPSSMHLSNPTSLERTAPSENLNPDHERRIAVCYRSLVEQYEDLVHRYYELSQAHTLRRVPLRRLSTSGSSVSGSTIDRGTDPMEPESASQASENRTTSATHNITRLENLRANQLESLRANLRRLRQPSFLSMARFSRRMSRTSREAHHSESVGNEEETPGDRTERVFGLSDLGLPPTPLQDRLSQQLRSSTMETNGTTLTTPRFPTTSAASLTTNTPITVSFASVRSAFRPRLSSNRTSEQVALDLRVRTSRSTTSSTNTFSTFSTSLRSAFQPRSATNRSTAIQGSSSGRQGNRSFLPPADVSVRYGIQVLSRHIDNMQRLCRARLEILQLQQIRRMWEDLQRQIGSLHAAVRYGNNAAAPNPQSITSSSPPPPRPSRPPLPVSPPLLPPPPLSSTSSGEDDGGGEPSMNRTEDEDEGLRVRELMEMARISGGEETEAPAGRSTSNQEGPSEGVSSGMVGASISDCQGNQTSRKRARIPVRFPESVPNRRMRVCARMSTGGILRHRPVGRSQRRIPGLRQGCGPSYACIHRLSEGVVSSSIDQPRTDREGYDEQAVPDMSRSSEGDGSNNNVSEQNAESTVAENLSNQDEVVASAAPEEETVPRDLGSTLNGTGSSNLGASQSSGPSTSSQASSMRQAGEDFQGRFCSMISRLEVLVRQQRENQEAYWRGRGGGETLWSRREAGRSETSEGSRSQSDFPIFTLSDSSSDESDNSNIASPLARRIQLLKQHHLRERQRRAWRRGMSEAERRRLPTFPTPPSTSSQLPPTSSLRDEPGTSSGTSADSEWQWTRESTRLRARQVLSMMVESLTEFFEQHDLSQETPHAILDEQIYNLYVLLQLALELTDLLLIQLMTTRRELEERWVNILRGPNLDGSNAQEPFRRTTSPQMSASSSSSSAAVSAASSLQMPRNLPRNLPYSRETMPTERQEQHLQQPSSTDGPPSSEGERNSRPRQVVFTVPQVQVNDVPVAPEVASLLGEPAGDRPRARSPPPPVSIFIPRSMPASVTSTLASRRGRPNPFVHLHQLRRMGVISGGVGGVTSSNGNAGMGEGRFRRFLHPRYVGPNPLNDEYREDPLQETMENILRGTFLQDSVVLADASMSVTHRIQAWDFSSCVIPEIGDCEQNVVVPECKIHNDASVDVSSDGRMLVTLLPPGRLQINTMLGIYSLEWGNLGECLFIMSLAQNAVSVSLSPTCRHLAVGLASRRVALLPSDRHTMAQLFRLEKAPPYPCAPPNASTKGKGTRKGARRGTAVDSAKNGSQIIGNLHHVRDIDQGRGQGYVSLNCIRWMPGAGQGLVYGTNTGQLKVLR